MLLLKFKVKHEKLSLITPGQFSKDKHKQGSGWLLVAQGLGNAQGKSAVIYKPSTVLAVDFVSRARVKRS